MNLQADELEEKISAIAQSIGNKCRNVIEIDLDAFLKKWREEYPSDKINKRFAADTLRTKFSAEDAGDQILRVQASNICKGRQSDVYEDSSKKKGPRRQVKKHEELGKELVLKILGYLKEHLLNKGSDDVVIKIEDIHRFWQVNNPGKSFKSYRIMPFKKFLLTRCDLRKDPRSNESIVCNEDEIIRKFKLINENPELACDKDGMSIGKEKGKVDQNNMTGQLKEIAGQMKSVLEGNDQLGTLGSDEKSALSEEMPRFDEDKKAEQVSDMENKEEQAKAR